MFESLEGLCTSLNEPPRTALYLVDSKVILYRLKPSGTLDVYIQELECYLINSRVYTRQETECVSNQKNKYDLFSSRKLIVFIFSISLIY